MILNSNKNIDPNKSGIEKVQKEKEEYKFIGRFKRTPGMKLFQYNTTKDEIEEIVIEYSDTAKLFKNVDGEVEYEYQIQTNIKIDTRFIQFEALNLKNAIKKVEKWKKGYYELNNIKEYKPNIKNLFN